MAIHIITKIDPKLLLTKIKRSIDSENIATWTYDTEGDFTHVSQWKENAWLRPYLIKNDELILGLIGKRNISMTKTLYGVYHGRFTEMLLTHFDNDISKIYSTSSNEDEYDFFE